MKEKLHRRGAKYFFTFALTFLCLCSLALAEQKIIEAVGYSVMGDGPEESTEVAKERARKDARRAAAEKAGIYVQSMSEVQAGELTRDEVKTIVSNVLEVREDGITAEVLGGMAVKYTCRITAVVDTTDVTSQLRQDREKFEDAVKINQDQVGYTEANDRELAALKEEFKTASAVEREEINQKVKRNEEKFMATQLHERGVTQYSKGDYQAAVEYYEQAAATDKLYAAPWVSLGWVHRERGEYDEAIESFQKAIELLDSFAVSYNGVAYAYNCKGEYEQAIEYCQKAIERDQNYAAPWNNLGFAYDALGNYEKAIECYQKATELDPKDPIPWSNLGSTYDDMGNYEKTIEVCKRALELDPQNAKAYNNLGYACLHLGDYDLTIEYCRKAVEIDPKYAEAWNGLSYGYNYKGKYYKALECCRRAIELNPNYANAYNSLGFAYGGLERYHKSYDAYKKAAELDPADETYQKNLAKAKKRL